LSGQEGEASDNITDIEERAEKSTGSVSFNFPFRADILIIV
jgi:hypothetical protein